MYKQIESDFEYNVVVLGDAKVGKTSLIKTIVTGCANLVLSSESDQMYTMLNMRKSVTQRELWKHKIELSDGSKLPVSIHDTNNSRLSFSIN